MRRVSWHRKGGVFLAVVPCFVRVFHGLRFLASRWFDRLVCREIIVIPLLLFLAAEVLECSGLSVAEIPSDVPAAQLIHDFRYRLVTLREARVLVESLPVADPVEEVAKRAALCWLRGFDS
jgi:hypothetical protein